MRMSASFARVAFSRQSALGQLRPLTEIYTRSHLSFFDFCPLVGLGQAVPSAPRVPLEAGLCPMTQWLTRPGGLSAPLTEARGAQGEGTGYTK
jgi:hypothetical protein